MKESHFVMPHYINMFYYLISFVIENCDSWLEPLKGLHTDLISIITYRVGVKCPD